MAKTKGELRKEMEQLRQRLYAAESALMELKTKAESQPAVPQVEPIPQALTVAPVPIPHLETVTETSPHPLALRLEAAAEPTEPAKATQPFPLVVQPLQESASLAAVPEPPQVTGPLAEALAPIEPVYLPPVIQEAKVSAPPAKAVLSAPAAPNRPAPPPRPTFTPSAPEPLPGPLRPRPPVPRPVVTPKPKRNLEDFLGTQLFLKAGVAILVIGVVFAMGIVFQKLGPVGKILMGYALGGGMLGGGIYAERLERYKTFGRGITAGAWGILYFVTYAGGFLEHSKVFPSETVSVLALLVAASAAVAFSLRYRNEWTTTSAFLLIFLGLAMAAWDLQPAFNLSATAIVALAMAVLVWRMGWVRLLGLGLPATWATLTFWILRRPEVTGDAQLMGTLVLCWAAFQLALIFWKGDEKREAWVGLSQIGNFLGGLGLCLHQTLHQGHPWMWAAGFGLATLAVAWAYQKQGRRAMYLLAATEGLAALALVTPLRLGWKHHLAPVYRLIGVEVLLAGGVFLKEKYFRAIAYGAFALTLLEILVLRLDSSPGTGRTLLLGTAVGIGLLNSTLLRTRWREACEGEIPTAPYAFSVAGTLLLSLLIGFEVSLKHQAPTYAALAALWLAVGIFMGLKDALLESAPLGFIALVYGILALIQIPGAPGQVPERLFSVASVGALLGVASGLSRRTPHPGIPESWASGFSKLFSFFAITTISCLLFRELPLAWSAFGFAIFSVLLMGAALLGGLKDLSGLSAGSLITWLVALGLLAFRPAPSNPGWWHLTVQGWSLAGVSSLGFGLEFLARSERAWEVLSTAKQAMSRWMASLSALILLVILILLEVPAAWIAVSVAALSVIHLALALLWSHKARRLSHRDRAYESLVLLGVALMVLWQHPASSTTIWGHLSARGWTMVGVAVAAFGLEGLVRLPASDRVFNASEKAGALWLSSLSGLALSLLVIWTEIPDPWVAPALGFLSVILLVLGLLQGFKEQIAESVLAAIMGLIALGIFGVHEPGTWLHLPIRGWNFGILAAFSLGQELILGAWTKAWRWSASSLRWLQSGHSAVAVGLLILLTFVEIAPLWGPLVLMISGIVWMRWARKGPSVLHAVEAITLGAASFVAMIVRAWPLGGFIHGVPQRTISVGLALLASFLLQREMSLASREEDSERVRLKDLMAGFRAISSAFLLATTLALGFLVKHEAFDHRHDELVPLLWGLISILYFERGRSHKQAAWTWLGHVLMGSAWVHLLVLGMGMTDQVHGISLRTWTSLPFLALLAYPYLTWNRLHQDAAPRALRFRAAYLYAIHMVIAVLVAFEIRSPWVLPVWALQATVAVFWGAYKDDVHWMRIALGMAILAGFRGFAVNLGSGHDLSISGTNNVAVPVACALLLAGYIRLQTRYPSDEQDSPDAMTMLASGRHRIPWFVLMAGLLIGYIWIEVSGTALTVWLTGYGFGMVALGFMFRERIGRLLGLGMLSACILKLFLWDLRGLEGLARVASFIVLGIVLIAVSYVYTRFKDRVEKML